MLPSRLIYFGDSLTDNGNVAGALTAVLGPDAVAANPQIGPQGAISNALAHPAYFGAATDVAVVNNAFSGARATGEQLLGGVLDINLGAQVARFVAEATGQDLSDAKAVLFIGLNDFNASFTEAIENGVTSLGDLGAIAAETGRDVQIAINGAIQALAQIGVGSFEIATLPLPRFFPTFDGFPARTKAGLDLILYGYNQALGDLAAGLGAAGLDVGLLDISSMSIAITEDPSAFGVITPRGAFLGPEEIIPQAFLDAGAVSLQGSPVGGDQAGYWDPLHPGEALHQVWGAYTAAALSGAETTILDIFDDSHAPAAGDDIVLSLQGNDTVQTGRGDDIAVTGTGDDMVAGSFGADILLGGSGDDTVTGGAGADVIGGGQGDDALRGGKGWDLIADGLGSDTVFGGAGRDTFVFVDERLIGGDDVPDGDFFDGGAGSDRLIVVVPEALLAAIELPEGVPLASAVLPLLQIEAVGIERIDVIGGRDALAEALDGVRGAQDADFWGVV